jgi:uncharacterized Zn finger protein (UPF0148 family)
MLTLCNDCGTLLVFVKGKNIGVGIDVICPVCEYEATTDNESDEIED